MSVLSGAYPEAYAVYVVLKRQIDEQYPHGQFVGIASGRVVADGDSIETLEQGLRAVGLTLGDVAIDQAGVEPTIKFSGSLLTGLLLGNWAKRVLPTKE